jgi:hypothetical protein
MKPNPFELLNYFTLPSILVHAIGLETGTASQDYIQLYNGDAKLLLDCLESEKCSVSNPRRHRRLDRRSGNGAFALLALEFLELSRGFRSSPASCVRLEPMDSNRLRKE